MFYFYYLLYMFIFGIKNNRWVLIFFRSCISILFPYRTAFQYLASDTFRYEHGVFLFFIFICYLSIIGGREGTEESKRAVKPFNFFILLIFHYIASTSCTKRESSPEEANLRVMWCSVWVLYSYLFCVTQFFFLFFLQYHLTAFRTVLHSFVLNDTDMNR